jgi:hypothetical protein
MVEGLLDFPNIATNLDQDVQLLLKHTSPFRFGVAPVVPWSPTLFWKVEKDGLADVIGIKPLVRVISLDTIPVTSLTDLRDRLVVSAGKKVEFRVIREGKDKVLKAAIPKDLSKFKAPN